MINPKSFSVIPILLVILFGFGSLGLAQDRTPMLADAAEKNDERLIALAIRSDADPNSAQADGTTALHWACRWENESLVERLMSEQVDVNRKNRFGVSPSSLAAQAGNATILRALLAAGADPNASLPGGETVLHTAARTGKRAAVELLLQHGAEPDAKERKGQTPMMWAAAEGNVGAVDALLAAGADFQCALPSGFTPFFFAVRQGKIGVVKRLLEAGVDVNATVTPKKTANKGPKKGTSALLLAIENGHFELALELLNCGADPNESRSGYTPLHAIVWTRKPIRGDGDPPPTGSGKLSSLDLVKELALRGANVNALHGPTKVASERLAKTGATPLLLAAETGDLPYIRLLIELGADPSIENADQCTPLLAASGVGVISNGDETAGTEDQAIETIDYLLELGADINAVDQHGKTAMHGAAYKSWTKVIAFLSERGADVNVWNKKNRRGWTPLKIAQGHRPGNFRPSKETIAAVSAAMLAAGVTPPKSGQANTALR